MTGSETTVEEEIWRRAFWQPGGGDAFLFYALYGQFRQPLTLDVAAYRSRGVPEWLEVRTLARSDHAEYMDGFLTTPEMAFLLRELPAEVAAAVRAAPECIVLRGEVADPADLFYLRDTLGLVTALLDQGGIAVLDVQTLTWWPRERWKEELWALDEPQLQEEAVILVSEDQTPGRLWFHTRGLRKFGRPDLSVRGVPSEARDAGTELCNRFIRLLARGYHIAEGHPVRLAGLPEGMTCHHAGSLADPDFNNVRVEIRYPD